MSDPSTVPQFQTMTVQFARVAAVSLLAVVCLSLAPAAAADISPPAPDDLLSLPGFPVYPPAGRPRDLTTTGYCNVDGFHAATGSGSAAAVAAGLDTLAQRQAAATIAFYFTTPRWSVTATDGASTGTNGDPVTLTFSFPDDGMNVPAFSGLGSEVASPNVLHARLDIQFLSREIWREQFHRIFRRWSVVSGLRFAETADDEATFGAAPGQTGVRGDIRIAGHHIDGAVGANVLAYSGFPDQSEMVIDTDNAWSSDLNGYRYFRNVLGHELGHGVGLDHPENRADTQWLLEPVISTAFDGPQEDDIRGAQRLYGDAWENNDTAGAATDLGTLGPSEGGARLLELSTDRAADLDWYRFDLSSGDQVAITVAPVGTTYTVQKQGQPVQGTVNAKAVADLKFTLYQADAVTVIADVNAAAAGSNESATVTLTAGVTYFLKVAAAGGSDDVQRYTLSVLPATNTRVPPRAVAPYDRASAAGRVFASARECFDPDNLGAANQGVVKVEWDTDLNGSYDQLGADLAAVLIASGPRLIRLRVTDADGLTATDTFTVNVQATTETKRITLTGPNFGGMIIGAAQTITWTTSPALAPSATLRIDVSYDCGFTWSPITAGTPNSGSFTWSPVSGPSSNAVLIRVADINDPVICDVNDTLLAISTTPSIVLTAPGGGESFNLGYPVAIQWTAVGVTAPIRIELSRDGGATFPTLMAATAPNTGSFSWTATAPTGVQNRIRISDSSNLTISDTGGDFTLAPTPTLALTAPVGGETFVQGVATAVTWTSTGTIAQINVEFSADGGVSFLSVAAVPNTGSYTWTVTQSPTTQGRIRISDAAAPTVVLSVSPADFTIPPPTLTLTAPNGGQTFTQGETRTVAWTTSGIVAQVNLELSLDNGGTWSALATNLSNTGSFAWFIAQAPSTQALVRVRDSAQPTVVQDTSDNPFTILSGVGLGSLAVLSPNGGEVLPAASPATLTFASTGFVPNVTVELSTDNGATWQTLTASTPNTGSYGWTTPAFYYPAMRLRVTDVAAPAVTDASDNAFQIGVQPRSQKKACALGSDSPDNFQSALVLYLTLALTAALAARHARRLSR